MKAKILLFVILSTVLRVAPCAFSQEAGQVNIQQLSEQLESLITTVEESSMACETRNAMVRRLRMLDDALLSGRLSAAQDMTLAWGRDAWWLESAGVLGAQVGSEVQIQLDGMADQIGANPRALPATPLGSGSLR
jgi:hypothetical protein